MATAQAAKRDGRRGVDRVFDAARDLFYRNGVRATGVDEIVQVAGVTKPTLYRAFESKDELAAACLRDYDRSFREWWDEIVEAHPGAPRAAILAVLESMAERARAADYRGCPLTNVAVEFPEAENLARRVAEESKRELRDRLFALSKPLADARADALADGLLLLIEGAMASRQVFGASGPSEALVAAGSVLIDAYAPPGRSGRRR